MPKIELPIKGMHCKSCEMILADALNAVADVNNVHVSLKEKKAIIEANAAVSEKNLQEAIEKAGYAVGDDNSPLPDSGKTLRDFSLSLLTIALFYLIIKSLNLPGLIGTIGDSKSLLVVLLVGLTAGFSTCMALVGGLVFSVSAKYVERHPALSTSQKFTPHLFFNLGRLLSFFLLGGFIGLIGKSFFFSGPLLGTLTIITGVIMLVLGLSLTGLFPAISNYRFTLPNSLTKFTGLKKHKNKEYSHANSIVLGALTFFLPCGFTQAMQLYAISSGSFLAGALIMAIFALGTTPGLIGLGGLVSTLSGKWPTKFFHFVGVLVITLALINVANGYKLTGFSNIFSSPQAPLEETKTTKLQVVRTTYKSLNEDIVPNNFKVNANQPVRFEITVNVDGRGCMSTIMIPSLANKPQYLEKGKTIVFEFTPKKGQYDITCAMGIKRGQIIAREEND